MKNKIIASLFIVSLVFAGCTVDVSSSDEPFESSPFEASSEEAGIAMPQACTTNSQCQLVADYCLACECRALREGESLAACPGPGVQCFADPCMSKTAACLSGQCIVR